MFPGHYLSQSGSRTWTGVGALVEFLMDRLGLRSSVGFGQRTAFLEQHSELEGEGLLKTRPHTNVRYSNEQSGPF